jgi:hypothetical protein
MFRTLVLIALSAATAIAFAPFAASAWALG